MPIDIAVIVNELQLLLCCLNPVLDCTSKEQNAALRATVSNYLTVTLKPVEWKLQLLIVTTQIHSIQPLQKQLCSLQNLMPALKRLLINVCAKSIYLLSFIVIRIGKVASWSSKLLCMHIFQKLLYLKCLSIYRSAMSFLLLFSLNAGVHSVCCCSS